MKCSDIITLLKEGKQPVVRLTDMLWDESFGDKYMIAKITHFKEGRNLPELAFDFSVAKEHNLALQSHSWFIGNNGETGTAFEAGIMDINKMTEEVVFELDQEVPVEMVENGPMANYLKDKASNPKVGTYVEWLEESYRQLMSICKNGL